mgnify:CR=1 FL=1
MKRLDLLLGALTLAAVVMTVSPDAKAQENNNRDEMYQIIRGPYLTNQFGDNWFIGVGGGGCNAVNYMYEKRIQGCTFIVCNTDSQSLKKSRVPVKIQLGSGLGAGCNPTEGRNAALNAQQEIEDKVLNTKTDMLFITAGMGGGTGTGAAPVIAAMAKNKGGRTAWTACGGCRAPVAPATWGITRISSKMPLRVMRKLMLLIRFFR